MWQLSYGSKELSRSSCHGRDSDCFFLSEDKFAILETDSAVVNHCYSEGLKYFMRVVNA